LRRLLLFGTGAAVIGIVLLIVAFFEAYIIVSSLQKEVGLNAGNTNLLLEDATLEAVFLGVMAALGYGLVAKGLDGIRREELMEMEGAADRTYGRGQLQGAQGARRIVETSNPPRAQPEPSHPGIKTSPPPAAPAPVRPVAPPKPAEESLVGGFPTAEDKKLAPVWGAPSTRLQEPAYTPDSVAKVQEAYTDSETYDANPGSPSTQTQAAGSQGVTETTVSQPSPVTTTEEPVAPTATETNVPQVSETPQAMAEPTGQAYETSGSMQQTEASDTSQPGQIDPITGLPIKPKRGRGRPKGSKSSKKVPEQGSTEPPSAPQ
jgi:hypothetical protein